MVEEFKGTIGIHDYGAAILAYCVFYDVVFVVLGRFVAYTEQALYASEAIDQVAGSCRFDRFGCFEQSSEEVFHVCHRKGGDWGCVIVNHTLIFL